MAVAPTELIQFPYSHYNEKVRWALALKRVPHRRRNLLPGPHAAVVLPLTRQTETPVVRFGNEVVHGSARILEELERRAPDPPLYPADSDRRRRALEVAAWFDTEAGPMVRRSAFAILLQHPDYVCSMFSAGHGALARLGYRLMFPVTRFAMSRAMGIGDAASIEHATAATQAAFDRIARDTGPSGYLVGDSFSVADLTASALLAPAADVEHAAMALPQPRPDDLQRWYERWAGHPGARWVREQYRRHRPPDA
jgi:glutathione S-transferase